MDGFEFVGTCYTTQDMALDAYYSRIQPFSFSQDAYHVLTISHSIYNGQWHRLSSIFDTSVGVETIATYELSPPIIFRTCSVPNDPLTSFQDGVILGWGVATVMLITFFIWRLKRI